MLRDYCSLSLDGKVGNTGFWVEVPTVSLAVAGLSWPVLVGPASPRWSAVCLSH